LFIGERDEDAALDTIHEGKDQIRKYYNGVPLRDIFGERLKHFSNGW
jgi:hypothetical protein